MMRGCMRSTYWPFILLLRSMVCDLPSIFSQVLYLAIGSFFVTLSASDGSTLSQLDLGSMIETTPLLNTHEGLGYVASTDSYLYAVKVADPQGPSLLWKYETGG
jgi:hypothetical protein